MITAITGVAGLFRDFGLSLAAVQAPSLSRGQRANLFWLNTAIGAALAVIFAGISPAIAAVYDRPELIPAVAAIATTFILDGASAQYRVGVIRQGRFERLSIVDVAAQVIGLLVALTVAIQGGGFWALVLSQIASSFAGLALAIIMGPWIPGLPDRNAQTRRFIGFGSNLLGVQVITYLSRNLDNVLLGRFWGAQQLGFYSRAYSLYALPQGQAIAPFTDLAVRTLAARVHNHPEYTRSLYKIQLTTSYAAVILTALLLGMADPVVRIALGPGWDETTQLLRILSIGGSAQMLGVIYYWIFLSQARTSVQLRCVLVSQPLAIVFMLIGLPFGATGVAWGVTAGLALEWLIPATWGMAQTDASGPQLLRNLIRPCLFGLGLGLASWAGSNAAMTAGPVVALAVGLAAGAVYTALVSVFIRSVRRDLERLARPASSVVHSRFRRAV